MDPHTSSVIEHEDPKHGLFDFFKETHLSFEGRKDAEAIRVFTRRHWFVLLAPTIGSIILAILPFFLILMGAKYIVDFGLTGWFMLGWVIYIMCIWFGLFYRLTMHSLDVWIVTNQRVVDSVQLGLFRRKVSELPLESIQDVSVNTSGIIQSYFNFGNVEVQTGASELRFMFDQVPRPIWVKDEIMRALKEYDENRGHVHDDGKKM